MHFRQLRVLTLVTAAMLGVGSAATAQDNNLARSYTVTPKAGMAAQFEVALRAHAQWRMDNNDPWTWGVSVVETGEDLGTYGIRSGGHSWADFDAYDAGFGPQGFLHWMATVAPLVESMTSVITMTDQANSKPAPPGTTIAFVNVQQFQLRPGRELEFNQLVTRAMEVLTKANAPGYWVWTSPVSGGGPGPYVSLVLLHTSWSDMAQPEPSFETVMMREMGEDGFREWMESVGQTYRGTESYTLRLRPDLSVNN
jgi:hypothetical protein